MPAFRLLCVWGRHERRAFARGLAHLDEGHSLAPTATLSIATCSVACTGFSQGEIDAEVAEKLALRLKFDAENGKGSYLKARSSEIYGNLVKRFDLDLSKKKKRAKR